MQWLILGLLAVLLGLLRAEDVRARRDRKRLAHVVYVNGTRGKSSVSRLIDAGLRAGGLRVFCKTTGTDPMTIGVDGIERPIVRRGRANIKEQLKILHMAVGQGADVLVAECMALSPELQSISQRRMVRADIGVITNVRLDHTDEMGETLEEICGALCSTLPENGVVFTADAGSASGIRARAEEKGSEFVLAAADDGIPQEIDFPENVALALAVCERLGVERETALEGMRRFQRDPYALSLFTLPDGGLFINGLSINDPQSSEMVYRILCERHSLSEKRLILLINNRGDRGYRTEHMLLLAQRLAPGEVWLLGASKQVMRRRLAKLPDAPEVRNCTVGTLPLDGLGAETVVFAVGNIANEGRLLMQRIEKEGKPLVS